MLSELDFGYSLFTRVRTRIRSMCLPQLFATMREQLESTDLISGVFTFADVTYLIAKGTLWEEQQKIEQLNNKVLSKVVVDSQAWIGCKGKKKYWCG